MGTAVGTGVAVGSGEGVMPASVISGAGVKSVIGAVSGEETEELSVPQEARIKVPKRDRKTVFCMMHVVFFLLFRG
ncbi:MAG: hypothetical protein IKH46_04350 [Lachnospiraceae bacterium]|nr:hypothetical protein [Lachnospiraceae bacterium]